MNFFTSLSPPSLRQSVLLAPSHAAVPRTHGKARQNSSEHRRLLKEAQRLRGRIYLADGAIEQHQLTESGRHVQAADQRSFHLLSLNDEGRVVACTRYLAHANTIEFGRLNLAQSPLTANGRSRPLLEGAVGRELVRARNLGYGYVEMGGWAITEELRGTTEAVRMVVTIYALARILGGALGISTVTKRHASSSILRRLGGAPLTAGAEELSPYYDPGYNCEMEILRFDSDCPSKNYESAVRRCQDALTHIPFLAPEPADLGVAMQGHLIASATA